MPRKLLFICVSICWISLGLSAEVQAQSSRIAKLESGEIIVTRSDVAGSDMPRFTVEGVVDAPPAKVWGALIDCDAYSKWYSSLASSKLVRKSDDDWICQEEAKLPFPFPNLEARVRVTLDIDTERWERKWTLIEGDYEINRGKCVLVPFEGDESKTLVTYTVHVDPKVALPDGFVKKGQKKKLPRVIEDIRAEVARR